MPYRAPAGATIDFPARVKITACERETHAYLVATPHGWIREEISSVTDHGRLMVLWRARKAEATEQSAVGDRSLPLVVPRAEVVRARPRMHASARPGRYSAGRRTA
jgi:hypothetical protein